MPAQAANLFLLEDLEYVGRTNELAESDLAGWINTYVIKPHEDLGRADRRPPDRTPGHNAR